MAKGARSNTRKHNNAKLRSTVFGPAADERTKRLSAKLQELSSQPLSKDADMTDADFNLVDKTQNRSDELNKEMDIDEQSAAAPKQTSGKDGSKRIQKRKGKKKRSSITFKPHPGKLKRTGKKN